MTKNDTVLMNQVYLISNRPPFLVDSNTFPYQKIKSYNLKNITKSLVLSSISFKSIPLKQGYFSK